MPERKSPKWVGLTEIVPFRVEDMLKANAGLYEKGPDGGAYVVVDNQLVTGQNPASSQAAAEELLKLSQQSWKEPSEAVLV